VILCLGDIGSDVPLPVMEGKAVPFKHFANLDAFPICLNTKDPDKIVETVILIAPSFRGIDLEDIGAPRCFEIEERLKKILNIPVFYDDQHGTAVIVLSGLLNALKIVGKDIDKIKIAVNGAGAAAIAVLKFLMSAGVKNAILCDSKGIIYEGRKENMNPAKEEMVKFNNRGMVKCTLADAIKGADVFLGLSVAGVRIITTGRSNFPNQVNNCLGFPGIFKGALKVRASQINEEMKLAASHALASLISEEDLSRGIIVTNAFDPRVVEIELEAVTQAAKETGVARI
jgi:malate dehydrogenase (oxaloacetate-decarboxylating)